MSAAPASVHLAASSALTALPEHRQQEFALRLDRWWPELIDGLTPVYPDDPEGLAARAVALAAAAYAERDEDLLTLDRRRILNPDWFQSPRMLGYAAYTERFAGDLKGVASKIDYLAELGVTYLHLMPLLLPRDGDNDGGYAVADYRTVRPDLGTVEDLRALAARLRESGISLVIDLVLNHVAAEHEWAAAARAGDAKYRAYFRIYGDRTMPDRYEATLPEVFPDFAPGNFSYDAEVGGWVWTTFNTWQWDVDWSNPDVFCEYTDIILFLANLGVEVLRLDAVAFLWKRLGTDSQNQPEVHAITQALRALARIAAPATLFKAEAIVAPRDLVKYLGEGHHHGKVSDLAYHNSLMVQVWSMLASGDARLAAHALSQLPAIPSSTAWMTYIRCHDDIGWAIDDGDAAAVGLNGYLHRAFLSDWYSGQFPGSAADGLVFQYNAATGDRRISGTGASLAGLGRAESDGTDVADPIARIVLAHALILGWGGVPVIWMGDELGQPNDPDWAEEPGHDQDNRWAHRPRLDWSRAEQRHDPVTPAGRLFAGLARLVDTRAARSELHASIPAEILWLSDPGVLPVLRRHPVGAMLGLYNVTSSWRPFPGYRLGEFALGHGIEAISGTPVTVADDGNLWLPPYAAFWIVRG
ncbi:alpha-amylase family protein [Jatrophihabitans telluris]|uniref:Alpha-amylase family protein n=1 Tax=Jatrophihabitans telluris TaxID=2038343 RepID=A0ABY4QZ09_9ACTN|nr:alpha-amylase family protein [Jatrophihabitans telluris]UQX88720.1 alpha-amylase family protein [Jatrophihabitans telluris]